MTCARSGPQTIPPAPIIRRRFGKAELVLYQKQTTGSVKEVAARLEKAVKDNQFGVLGTIDLRAKMAEKGVALDHDCLILEVCNPKQAKAVLDVDPAISTSLPCRISVFAKDGRVTIAAVKPTLLIAMYEGALSLKPVAEEVERTIIRIIDAAARPGQEGSHA